MSFWLAVNYRESYGMFCANGVLFNHESPRRGETFVTRKITRALARIKAGLQEHLYLGNLDACRDWGYAPDYTNAMWRILQADEPEDFVIATGETHSVREFLEHASAHLDLDPDEFVRIDERYYRPAEVDVLLGDAAKARAKLGWEPTVTFEELVRIMVDADVKPRGPPPRRRGAGRPLGPSSPSRDPRARSGPRCRAARSRRSAGWRRSRCCRKGDADARQSGPETTGPGSGARTIDRPEASAADRR